MSAQKVVCVLGMNRSGTTLATRLLNLMGVELGDDLVRPAADNPVGFWEPRGIVRLNEQLLRALHGSWQALPALEPGWEQAPELDGLRARAQTLLDAQFADRALWGFKDPRSCLTLPFWKPLLPPLHHVLCVRHPRDVVRSVAHRDGLAEEHALQLWIRYTQRALDATVHQPHLVVAYEDTLADGAAVLRRMARWLELPEPGEKVVAAAKAFVDPGLAHHRQDGIQADEPAFFSKAVQAYAALRGRQSLASVARLLDEAGEALAPAWRRLCEAQRRRWLDDIAQSSAELAEHIPEGQLLVLADDMQWGTQELVPGRLQLPFLERDGSYFGPPPEDASAIRELERLRAAGAAFYALARPSFWWLDHYPEFTTHLRAHFPCLVQNERVILFRLAEA